MAGNTNKLIMTTKEKSTELVQDLGVKHAIYLTEEVLTILKDWEGTELAQQDWVEIKEIILELQNNVVLEDEVLGNDLINK